MITERKDAFKHNACKKLAQLAKVIFLMSKAKLERNEEINNIIIKYETGIGNLVRQHEKSIEEIAKNLVLFRKNCIDQECQKYALQYKVVKSKLTDLYKEKLQTLQNIVKEGESISSDVNNIQNSYINELNKYIEYSNQIQTKIANYDKKSQQSINKKAQIAIQPILEKIADLRKENDAKMKQILTQHAQDIRANRTEIYTILRQEILLRKDDLNNYYSQLESLKAEVNSLRNEYEQTKKNQDNFNNDFKKKRNSIITTTNNNYNEINNTINNLINKEKSNESERNFQIQEINKVKQTLFNSHQNELNNLISQIQYQKHQIDQFETYKTAEIEKKQSSIENFRNSLQKEFENAVKNRNDTFSEIEKIISQSAKDSKSIKGRLQLIANETVSKTANKKNSFQNQIQKEIQSITAIYDRQLNNFKEAAKNRVTIMANSLKNQDNINQELQKQIRKEINQILDELKKLQLQIEKEIEEKKQKGEKEKDEYNKANIMRESNRKNEIEMVMNRKRNEKEKKISEFKEKSKIELIEKRKKLEIENNTKMEEFIKQSESFFDLSKEENEHQSKMLKMKGKLNFAIDQFEQSKKNCEQRLTFLQNEIQNLEKQIRQIQRKIKTETQGINEEFEMKIQVEQVKLNNAIENISKLYEKDENLRGVEIIEAIRKLRDIKNRSVDLQAKKKHEIENEEKNFQKKKIEIENEIKDLRENKEKIELEEKLKQIIENSANDMKLIENERNSKLKNLTDKTSQIQIENSKKISELKSQIDAENKEFQTKADEIKAKEEEIKNKTDEQLEKCTNEFELKKKSLIDKFNDQVSKLKTRIESAKKVQNEEINNTNKDYDTAVKNDEDLISRKGNDDQESLKKLYQNFIQKNAELAQKTKDLLMKVSNLHINQIISPMRKSEETKLNNLKDELNSKDQEIVELFDSSFKTLEVQKSNQQNNNSNQQQQQQPMQFKVGQNNSKRTTKKNKNDFPKMFDAPKKPLPAIMTPQFV